MKLRAWMGSAALVLSACGSAPEKPASDLVRAEFATTGSLRFGLVAAPAATEFFVVPGADGQPRGVAADLARDLARRLGVPIEFTVATSSGDLTTALLAGKLDAAFMPPDAERRKLLDFTTYYFVDDNTYLVPAGSRLKSVVDADSAGVRIVAIAGTTTSRTLTRVLTQATSSTVKSADEALQALRAGRADAFALTHASLAPLQPKLPGSRVLEGSFNRIGLAMALPKGRPNALAFATAFIEDGKASGRIQSAFDAAGLGNSKVAKAGER
jgi:polar amino acid transport system substrate-binding protein